MPKTNHHLVSEFDRISIYLFALFLPWPIWVLEQYIYSGPEIIEEAAKTFLVYLLVRFGAVRHWRDVALVGILFALSETLFYLYNANIFSDFGPIILRVILTWPMHLLTVLLAYKIGTTKMPASWLFAFFVAALVHGLYNLLVSYFTMGY